MNDFIELTSNGQPVSVNTSHIAYFCIGKDGLAVIHLTSGYNLYVEHSYEFLFDELRPAVDLSPYIDQLTHLNVQQPPGVGTSE